MPIKTACESCFVEFKVAEQFAGKKVRCKSCGEVNTIPIPKHPVLPASPSKSKRTARVAEDEVESSTNLDNIDLSEAVDDGDGEQLSELRPKSGKKGRGSKKRSAGTKGQWYDRERLSRNPMAIVAGLELATAIPGLLFPRIALLYGMVWVVPAVIVLLVSMLGGIIAAVVLNPTAMATSLLVGNSATRRLINNGSIQVREQSPVYDFIMKCLLTSLVALLVGIPLWIGQISVGMAIWGNKAIP